MRKVLGGNSNTVCQMMMESVLSLPNPGAIATPPSTFADLYSGTINGTWTFYAGDASAGDIGDVDSWTLEITYLLSSVNDDCANAATIGCSLSNSVAGTTLGAGVDAIYSDCGAGWQQHYGTRGLVCLSG